MKDNFYRRVDGLQKDFKDFTVGELLDLGLKVDLRAYDYTSVKEAKRFLGQFEGAKISFSRLTEETTTAKAWKGEFTVTLFVEE